MTDATSETEGCPDTLPASDAPAGAMQLRDTVVRLGLAKHFCRADEAPRSSRFRRRSHSRGSSSPTASKNAGVHDGTCPGR